MLKFKNIIFNELFYDFIHDKFDNYESSELFNQFGVIKEPKSDIFEFFNIIGNCPFSVFRDEVKSFLERNNFKFIDDKVIFNRISVKLNSYRSWKKLCVIYNNRNRIYDFIEEAKMYKYNKNHNIFANDTMSVLKTEYQISIEHEYNLINDIEII